MNQNQTIYLDNAATTKVDNRVLEAMLPYFTEIYGNASSNHTFGELAKKAIEMAREQTAAIINAKASEITFTSGATEAINLALKGYVEANIEKGNHIITVKTEHKAVLATCEYLEERGIEVSYLNVNQEGLISLQELQEAIRPDTILIAIMYVNNETGVIQPIEDIGKIAHQNNIVFFCDATQAIGKIKVDVANDNIDMLCFSGHKFNGPKGIGALYKKKEIQLTPLLHGGGQENNLRGGTYNTPLIVGLGKACEIAQKELKINASVTEEISIYLSQKVKQIPNSVIIGSEKLKAYNIVDVLIPGLNSEVFIAMTSNLSLSNGSACTSQIIESSHVLKAMKLDDQECKQTIRISIDKTITKNQIDELVNTLKVETRST
ncbi:cysteine desulfurase family protein [Flavobacterium sp. 102]|uniref:cysteine desulfurase family protein n=1 Tax=Flavobacterium sp. 102 TaxID=2135623 RepID=UPI000F1E0C50|nr:cysteine desulfurase family protein [Flavobacterium sp. 102]RKS03065.1 cysteine desulfurase IscS [Flavobacterium sp. 102]